MSPDQFQKLILKLNHDLAGQRRCLDLVSVLLHEGTSSLEDAKKLLNETIVQFDLTQKIISSVHIGSYNEPGLEKGIS